MMAMRESVRGVEMVKVTYTIVPLEGTVRVVRWAARFQSSLTRDVYGPKVVRHDV